MKVKFNKFERFAGLFVMFAFLGCIAALGIMAVQQGWFDSKVSLVTHFKQADGIYPGTRVQMAGLSIGKVSSVELKGDNMVVVQFEIKEKYLNKVKGDSYVRIARPFILSEKILDITPGSSNSTKVAAGDTVGSEESVDLMDMLSGKGMGPYLSMLGEVLKNMKTVIEAFVDPKRARAVIEIFDSLSPLVRNANTGMKEITTMSKQLTKDQNIEKLVENLELATTQMRSFMPENPQEFSKQFQSMGKDAAVIMRNMAQLTEAMNTVIPALTAVAPDLPKASKRAIEAMDEAVVVLKAMEKSFLLRGSVADVREEEAKDPKRKDDKKEVKQEVKKELDDPRMPASEDSGNRR